MTWQWLVVLSRDFQDCMRGMFYRPKGNMLILLLPVAFPLFNTILTNVNTTTVTTIATMPKGMKVKFSRDLEAAR